MTRRDSRLIVLLLAILALAFLSVAAWMFVQGNPLEAAGHSLVATLAVLVALLINTPDRPRRVQRWIVIAAMTLVPITLAVFVTSIFF